MKKAGRVSFQQKPIIKANNLNPENFISLKRGDLMEFDETYVSAFFLSFQYFYAAFCRTVNIHDY